jgi:RNA polymerase sigma factor (sigma-70 family)
VHQSELERELERLHADSWGWALACCGRDRELAADALQSAYERILARRAKYDGRSSLRTWVFGVIRFAALEELRRSRRDRSSAVELSIDAADPAPAMDDETERAERNAALTRALAALSPRQREVLQLVFYHEMTIEEAATVMGISVGSARTHYERGKHALARLLASEHVR